MPKTADEIAQKIVEENKTSEDLIDAIRYALEAETIWLKPIEVHPGDLVVLSGPIMTSQNKERLEKIFEESLNGVKVVYVEAPIQVAAVLARARAKE